MTAPLTSIVAGLPASVPFVGPEALERARGRPFRARLGANESAFGPAPGAIAAMQEAATEGWKYGDPENYDLKHAIAARHGVTPAHVVVGEGIDALFGVVARLHVEPLVAVVTSLGAYPTFAFHVAGNGGRLVTARYRDDREDLEALLALARTERPRLVFLANPDNPMGSWWDAAAVEAFAGALSRDVLLCLDEAYADFAPAGSLPAIDPDDTRVLRFRTFSKAHGMAGLRIGYAFGAPEVVAAFDRVRNHFGVNRVAQAGALASLADDAHIAAVVARVERARARIAAIAADNGLQALPSATNFVTVDCGRDGAFARAVLAALAERDVFIRMPGVAPLDRCIRISAAPDAELDVLAAELPGAVAAAASQPD
jgi:histidinol-phosphate aminotransferase